MNQLRNIIPAACLFGFGITLGAQIPEKGRLDAGTGLFFSGRMLHVTAVPPDVSGSASSFGDSLNKADMPRTSLNFSIHHVKPLNRMTAFRIGFAAVDYGFRRVKKDIRFGEWIHPEIGLVADNSQTGPRDVFYDVRYRYAEIPMTFMWNTEYGNPWPDLDVHIMAGIAPGYLMQHETVVRLRGFTTSDGLFVYHIKNTGYSAQSFNVALLGGVRINYVLDKRLHALLAPSLRLPVLNSSSGIYEQHRSWQIGTEIGLSYDLSPPGKK